jgi:hypothetical protein
MNEKPNGALTYTDFDADVKWTMDITGWSRETAENAVRQWWQSRIARLKEQDAALQARLNQAIKAIEEIQ